MTDHTTAAQAAQQDDIIQPVLTDDEISRRWDIYVSEPSVAYPLTDADKIAFARAIETAVLSKLRAPVADERSCEHCDGTGDVHGIDGEWRGVCTCPAGRALASAPVAGEAQGWSGWACQYPNKLPRLYGTKKIAELNCDPANGDRMLFLAENAAPQASTVAGEAVSWQVRRTDGSPLACWESCTKELYDLTKSTGRYSGFENGPPCEVRALGVIDAAPQASAEPVRDVNAAMAAEYQRWIDWFHKGRDYDSFLKECVFNKPQVAKDGGQQPKRYVVLKASGSRYAYVNDTQEGRSINRFDVLKGDGWRYAHEFADRMNNEHASAALSATQPEQGERDEA